MLNDTAHLATIRCVDGFESGAVTRVATCPTALSQVLFPRPQACTAASRLQAKPGLIVYLSRIQRYPPSPLINVDDSNPQIVTREPPAAGFWVSHARDV